MKNRILLIEDDDAFANGIRLALRSHSLDVVWAPTGADGINEFRKNLHGFATAIIDYCLPDHKGSEVAKAIRKLNASQDILFASGFRDPDFLIDLLETGGARSFLPKGRSMTEIVPKILESVAIYENFNRVLGHDGYSQSKVELELKRAGFIGRSFLMYEILQKIERYRSSPYPVLIVGETGSGKELVANALVPQGKILISINCARFAGSENLLESELFGHVKGAFTGANNDKAGLLTRAHGQVLFLDEFHALSLSAQAKLLRFLETRKFRRVGDDSGREITIDLKIVAATKPDIRDHIKNKLFLEDLYHRVAQLEILVPPLRARTEDIEPLVRAFQDEFNEGLPPEARKQVRISTIQEMAKYPWTGNVRELLAAVRRMLTDCKGDIVNPKDLHAAIGDKGQESPGATPATSLSDTTSRIEIEQIKKALAASDTLVETAALLGISRWVLNRKLAQFSIYPKDFLSTAKKSEDSC